MTVQQPSPEWIGRAQELAAQARELHRRASRQMQEAREARARAVKDREAAESWRREIEEDLRGRWLSAQQRAAAIAREVAELEAVREPRLTLFEKDFWHVSDPEAIASALLAAALTLSRAQMGNVQLFDPAAGGLRIVAHHRFGPDFLRHFALVRDHDHGSACGRALSEATTVHVRDAEHSAVFAAGPTRDVVLDAGVRAVRSIPLVSSAGTMIGMISVHYERPHDPDATESELLAMVAAAGARRLSRARDDADFTTR
ncbi:GAF domain-containing protein [Actinoplanes sp. GCM10030250]|uniref:GAF domain-containing protein n=1 Tax=Actinoplanes sp. GCM10030250 TaxID=3273376 RepID=UPI0036171E45